MKKTLVLLSLVCLSLIFFSCNRNKEETINFDNSYPLALAPDVSWALVTEPYAAYRNEMNWNSEIGGYCRKGEILQVLGSAVDKEKVAWYKFEKGWLPGSSLAVYSNRLKAQTAAESLKD